MTGLDLAAIGDCAVPSVICPAGRHIWFGFPRLDAAPVSDPLPGGALPGGVAPEVGHLDVWWRRQRVREVDPGALRGDLLRIYSQVGLIFAAMRLPRSRKEGVWGA